MGAPNGIRSSHEPLLRKRSMRLDVVQRKLSFQRKPRPTSSCQTQLPMDLLQFIFDELDEASVRQCALAARCFLALARRKLFTSISLCEEEYSKSHLTRQFHKLRVGLRRHISFQMSLGSTRVRQFAELLEMSPELGAFVEELVIEGLELVADYRSWYNVKDAPLHLILHRLPNLKSISFLFSQNYPLVFHRLPSSSCKAIVKAIQSPKIQRVVMENVVFEAVGDLLHFLDHAVSGGNLTELSIASLGHAAAKEPNVEWKQLPVPSFVPTNATNVLQSFQLVGTALHVEKVLQWARSDNPPIHLNELSVLEIVAPMSLDVLRHITQIVSTQSTTSRLRHLGLTYSPDTLRSLCINCGPLAQSFLCQVQNALRSITLYPVSRNYDDLFSFPEEMVDWWCSLFKTFSFPNLSEFRVQRRGTHAHYMVSGMLFGDTDRFARNAAQWQRLEVELERSAPNATLRVELRSRGYFGVDKWRSLYFPENNNANLEVFFPLAHIGRVPLVVDLKVNTKRVNRRLRLREDATLPKNLVKHRGHFVYTPETRWRKFAKSDCRPSDMSSRTEFEYVFLM